MAKLEVAYSPDLYSVYENKEAIVIVIDIFRATSAICNAFEHGVSSIIPVKTVEEARAYQRQGFLAAAERQGQIVEGFDIGNSPFHYMTNKVKGQDVVLTTTNGTRAISISKDAKQVLVGSFLNISALCNYLKEQEQDVLLLCAGWKGRYNLEDSLFAGAVVERLEGEVFNELSDSARSAKALAKQAGSNLNEFLKDSSHRKRLKNLDFEKDIEFCLKLDVSNKVPALIEGRLRPLK